PAPVGGPEKCTLAPAMGFPCESFTTALSGVGNAIPTAAVCPPPPLAVMEAAGPGRFSSGKLAALETPGMLAVTLYPPAVALAETSREAIPWDFVATDAEGVNVAVAPLAGAAKVTVTPLSATPSAFFTTAINGVLNAVPTVVVWPIPPTAAIEAAGPEPV